MFSLSRRSPEAHWEDVPYEMLNTLFEHLHIITNKEGDSVEYFVLRVFLPEEVESIELGAPSQPSTHAVLLLFTFSSGFKFTMTSSLYFPRQTSRRPHQGGSFVPEKNSSFGQGHIQCPPNTLGWRRYVIISIHCTFLPLPALVAATP